MAFHARKWKWEPFSKSGEKAESLRRSSRFRGCALGRQLREAGRGGGVTLPGHCQSGWGRSGYDSRNLQMAHQTVGHPLLSEEARLVSNPKCAAIASNNANWVPSVGRVHAELWAGAKWSHKAPGLGYRVERRPNCSSTTLQTSIINASIFNSVLKTSRTILEISICSFIVGTTAINNVVWA